MPARRRQICCVRALLLAFYAIYGAASAFVLALFIFWLIFRPQNIQFSVDDALLEQFDLIPSKNDTVAMLRYNLALNVSVRNPNKRIAAYYERIRAIANYGDKSFATVALNSTPFRQGRGDVTVLRPVFVGRRAVRLEKREIERYDSEKAAGIFRVDLKLDLRMRLRYGKIKTGVLKPPMVECVFEVPIMPYNGESKSGSTRVKGFEASSTSCGHVLTSI